MKHTEGTEICIRVPQANDLDPYGFLISTNFKAISLCLLKAAISTANRSPNDM